MVNKRRKGIAIVTIFCLLIGMLSIVNVDYSTAASKNKIMIKSLVLYPTDTFTQQLLNNNDQKIKATKVKWKSKKPAIAKINKKGKITAIKVGKTIMTAKYKGKTYKFTVRVKNPYKGGRRPTKFSVMNVYNTLGYDLLTWEGLSDTPNPKYEIYVSKNGGSYYRLKTTKNWYYENYNIWSGLKCKYKVREVLGKYHSKFTPVQTANH